MHMLKKNHVPEGTRDKTWSLIISGSIKVRDSQVKVKRREETRKAQRPSENKCSVSS